MTDRQTDRHAELDKDSNLFRARGPPNVLILPRRQGGEAGGPALDLGKHEG